ncbi:MAG: DoxX family protein [Maricaulis sp.]|jgi:putative oxidoreductase|uniref:DoxX family protein n=1 Tax=Maricaulis sp. TaxID=1486257 RepID=UPI001B21ABA2|nr:DoxX family protein [Maricaulis sp.]MBO6730675.1 DoxX family protein [Maricaulis sp.]MBO6846890.1 DoxX family protein [Maricaulis sp.]MBO6876248.1 DoxX family protein [Maricaulis sp.]MDM7984484.1 DoxX family protein [Maricaulis sp.]
MSDQQSQYGVALLRVSLGVLFLAHGLLKLLVFTPAGTVGFFESLGLSGLFAYLVMAGEIGGGLLLIAGAYTRVIALALLPIALGATFVHLGNGWVFSAEGGGWEFPLFLAVTTLAQALLGSGAFALRAPELPFIPRELQA